MIPEVRDWLDKAGFALELRAASIFQQAGFEVHQASYYLDPETGKGREIDIVAIDPDDLGVLDIRFMVECKSGKKPWVLLTSPDAGAGYNRLTSYGVLSPALRKALARRSGALADDLPWFKKEGQIAYQARQALSDSDPAYVAAMGVAKASTAWLAPTNRDSSATFRVVFPVIVIDAPLLECSLAADGKIEIHEVDSGEWLFTAMVPEYFGTCIRVVTLQHLASFASEARASVAALRTLMVDPVKTVVESWKRR